MGVLERDKEKQKQRKQNSSQEEEEDTMAYMARKKERFLNEESDTFSRTSLEGINTKRSVFDETTVFRTKSR